MTGLNSMTGYASHSDESDGFRWDWEARSVNGKGLDVRLRLPDGLDGLEAELRKAASAALKRGNVTVSLKLRADAESGGGSLDEAALSAALAQVAATTRAAEGAGVALRPVSAADVVALPGVIAHDSERTPPAKAIRAGLDPVLAALSAMRAAEGAKLAEVLTGQLDEVERLTGAARNTAEARAARAGGVLRARVDALMEASEASDPARLAQELALLAVKADVTEELDRLEAHIAAAREMLATGGAVGRKLDFLMQEFMREANTLCSKANAADLTQTGLDLKVVIDQMREQVQNLE